jgi:hypothetical protein
MGYTCHLCNDAEPASILITPLSGGDTLAIGQACLVTGYCGLLSVLMGVDAEQLYDGLLSLQQATKAAEAAAATETAAKPSRAPRKPRAAASGPKASQVKESAPAAS